MVSYAEERQGLGIVSYGIFNPDNILLVYGDDREEIIAIAGSLKVGVMDGKMLADELERSKAYYALRGR